MGRALEVWVCRGECGKEEEWCRNRCELDCDKFDVVCPGSKCGGCPQVFFEEVEYGLAAGGILGKASDSGETHSVEKK